MNKDKKFLIDDTKERIKNIKEVTFKTINLRVSKRSNLTDEDYLTIRDTSRILLDDIKTIFNNLKRIEITEDECKDYLGFNVEETKTAIYSTRDMLKGLREKNTAVDEPKIYKLLNNSIDNYSKALELIDNYLNPPQSSVSIVKDCKGESTITITNEGIFFNLKSFKVTNKYEEIKKILNDNEISIDIDDNFNKKMLYAMCECWNKFNKTDKNKLIDLILE